MYSMIILYNIYYYVNITDKRLTPFDGRPIQPATILHTRGAVSTHRTAAIVANVDYTHYEVTMSIIRAHTNIVNIYDFYRFLTVDSNRLRTVRTLQRILKYNNKLIVSNDTLIMFLEAIRAKQSLIYEFSAFVEHQYKTLAEDAMYKAN